MSEKYLSQSGLARYTEKFKEYISNLLVAKVDKVDGKSLSTNDYTDEDKAKVDSIGGSIADLDTTGILYVNEESNLSDVTAPYLDASLLGGQAPEYYATATAVDDVDKNLSTEIENRQTAISEMNTEIDSVKEDVNSVKEDIANLTAEDVGALPIEGGTLSGDLTILKSNDAPRMRLRYTDGNRQGSVEVSPSGWVNLNNYGDLNNLNTSFSGIMVHPHTSTLSSMFQVRANISNGEHRYNLFGEHNKPTGTYTGTKSAFSKDIGGVGKVLYVYGNGVGAFVYGQGAIVTPYNSTTIHHFTSTQACFASGKLTYSADVSYLNDVAQYSWILL